MPLSETRAVVDAIARLRAAAGDFATE